MFREKLIEVLFYSIIFILVIKNIKWIISLAAAALLVAAVNGWMECRRIEEEKKKLLRSGMNEIDRMNGKEFEEYLGALFEDHGYKVKYTKDSGDHGADLLLQKGVRSVAVQANCCNNPVGFEAVQQVSSGKLYYGMNEAWTVTNRSFTKNAREGAEKLNVLLIDRNWLIDLITENKTSAQPQKTRPV